MRRLVLLLIGLMALGLGHPLAPAMAAPVHHGHAMPAGSCDEGQCAQHVCLGCAIDPAEPAAPDRIAVRASLAPQPRVVSRLGDHRPGFDPPPPRAFG